MGYYVKRLSDGRIDGVFSLEEILQRVILKQLNEADCIIEAKGQSSYQLASSDAWTPIGGLLGAKSGSGGMESKESAPSESESLIEGCPICGESMPPATIVCKHCGEMLSQEDRGRVYAGQRPLVPESKVAELAKRRAQEVAKSKEAQYASQGPQAEAESISWIRKER